MNNEELQRLVFETLGACSWEYDLAAERIVYSDEFFALVGYTAGEIEIDRAWVADNIHPEDMAPWRNAFISSIKGQSRYFDCELRFLHKDGHYVWIQTRGIVTERDDDGRALRIVGMVFDISERKTAKESELRYRLLLDNIPDALSLKDREGRYLYINRRFEDWLGKPSHQIYGQTAEEIFHPETRTLDQLREHERKVWEEGETVSMERQFPLTDDGQVRHAVITKFPIFDESGGILAIGTTNTDVTERYLAREAMRESEERYRLLFESAPAVLVESDWSKGKALIDGLHAEGVSDIGQYLRDHPELLRRRDQVIEVIDANREALRVFQVGTVDEFIETMSGELSEEQRRSTIEDLVNFAAGERRSRVQTRSFRKNGEEFPIVREVEMYGRDADDWSRMLVTLRETSAEEALRENENRLRQLFDLAPAVLAESDWSAGKALVEELQNRGVTDLKKYLVDHPDLTRRRDQIMRLTSVNQEALRIYKADSAEILIAHIAGEMNEIQRLGMIEDLVNFAEGKRRSSVVCRTFRVNGEEFPILAETEFYGTDPDDWTRVMLTIRDTSAEEAVRLSEQRFRQLFELAPVVLAESDWTRGRLLVDELRIKGVDDLRQYLLDNPGMIRRRSDVMTLLSVNQEAVEMYRANDEDALRAFLETELTPEQHASLIEDLVNFAEGRQRSSVRTWTRRVDGDEFPIIRESEIQGSDPGNWSRVLITIRDDSTTEALRLNEQRYRDLFESAPAVLCETDWSDGKALIDRLRAEGVADPKQYLLDHPQLIQRQDQVMKVLTANHEALQIYRAESESQLIEYAAGELNEFQRRSLIEELCNFASGQRRSIIESHNWRLDGEEFPVVRVGEIHGADPEDWSQVLLSVRDTSAEETVRLSEERYRRLFESAPAVLGESDWSAAKKLVDDLRARGVEDIKKYLIENPDVATRRKDFMQLKDVNQEALRIFRVDSKENLINFLNRPLQPSVRLGIIEDLATFVGGERRSTLRTWVPSATGDRIPIVRVSEIYSSNLEDWSRVLISIRDISKEEAVRMSEIRFRRLFESAPAALYESDWSKGKKLVDGLIEQGVGDVRQYLIDHPELIRRRDDVHTILNANDEAIEMFRSTGKESHIRFVEGELIEDQRLALIEVLDTFTAGKRRSRYRTRTVRETGEIFPIVRNCELISSDRDDWSLVLVSIQDLSIEEEAAHQLEAYQEELRLLAGKISSAEESERRRISSELHDGTIQNLVLARIHLANLKNSLETAATRGLADSINQLLETSLKETRSLIFEISPPVLYELGLEPAVEWLAEHYKKRTGVGVRITSDQRDTRLGEEMNIVIFQTARELLVNVAKHARAQSVSIDWRHLQDRVVLSIEDDGIGFDIESPRVKLATEGGFGLFAIRERLKLMGASIDIQSSSKGTRVTVTAPAEAGEAASAAAV